MSGNTNGSTPINNNEEPNLKPSATQEESADTKKPSIDDHAKDNASDSEDEGNDKVPFPVILHEIVCDPATDHCIHWLPEGNLFTISDKKKFAKEVMPKLNGHAKFTSFTRRLKRWGFSRIASGPQIGAYQNPDFTKEEPERVKNIKYMHPKPLSLAAIQRQNAKMQAAAKMNAPAGHNSLGNQAPPQDLTMLQTLLAQQQQMGMQMPGQVTNPQAFMASSAPPTNSVAMQLAMLQEMQNQHGMQQMQVSLAASAEEPKPNESFGEKLVRTNPALAAQLIEAKSLNMMSPNGGMAANIASNPMLAMLAAQSNRMQQPNMNLAMLQQMSNPRGEQNNLTAMMFALLQQEQQQQQLQQPKDFIKNFMSQQIQPQPQDQRQQQRASLSDNSLVTPMSSAASLHANLIDGKFKQGSPSDENWLSALLNRNNNAGTKQNPAPNPDGNGKSGDV